MEISFKNKVVFITGGSTGIGFATAQAFAKVGAQVAIAAHRNEHLDRAIDTLVTAGYTAFGIACDVADEKQIEDALRQTMDRYGQLDCAFNNAGIMCRQDNIAKQDEAEWKRVLDINLLGIWRAMKHEIAAMEKTGGGTIVNCSSIGAHIGVAGQSVYIASKHAVNGLTKTAAIEYAARNIRINAVSPGIIQTPMVDDLVNGNEAAKNAMLAKLPIGRLGQPDEIAAAVLWLSSPFASNVIGHDLVVDGGYLIQ